MSEPTLQEILGVKVDIGIEAERFLKSELGLAVVSRQRAELSELTGDLENPAHPLEKIREIQLQVAARRRALAWLLEAIDEAKIAFQQLEQSEAED